MESAAALYSKMKVADLKKELKTRGLAVTGNKNELVERLLAAGHAPLGSVEGEEEEFDEEEILAGDMADTAEISKQEEEAALSGGNLKVKKGVALKTPLKKDTPKTPAKKPAVQGSTVSTKSPTKKSISAVTAEQENEPPKKVAKADDEEKSAMEKRAERFGVPMTEEAKKQARAARFGELSNGTVKGSNKLSPFTGTVDIDVLKKRAERFGEVTSKSLTKADEVEKKKSRMDRFGSSKGTTDQASIDAAKAARAARFGAEAKAK